MSKQYGAELNRKLNKFRSDIKSALDNVGLKAVTHARELVTNNGDAKPVKPIYTVQTGNLTSSIGYVVTENANIVSQSNFETVMNGQQGSSKGRSLSRKAAAEETSGIALVIVAGMEYAPYVEAKGYDVLNSAELMARAEAEKMIKTLIKRLEK